MIFHTFLIFSVLTSAAVAGVGAAAPYDPTDVYLFNCGDTSDKMDNSGRTWTAEQRKVLPPNILNASFSSAASFQESGVSQVPYMTARIFRYDFTYSFPVSPGWKFLRLYFYPTRYGSVDATVIFFSVTVNGFTLLKNFSAELTAKASNDAFLIKEFILPVSSGHPTLNLTFAPSPNSYAFVNGIEIVSMPDRLYTKGGFDDKITYVGYSIDYEIDNTTAFETVYRMNVGGKVIDGVSDTGMFRPWLSDENFLLGENSGIIPVGPDVMINYTEKTPEYVAPEDVYKTYRTMGNVNDPNLNLNFNLTWLFTVDAGFTYLVRLHFCETLTEVTGPGQRVFTIFIGNQIAKLEMDVIQLSGGSRIPMYLDFSVFVGFESGPRPDLRLDLHPFKDVKPKYYDAILNGVEILKMNGSEGNLAGPNPNPPPSSTPISVTREILVYILSHVLVITLGIVGSAIVLAMFVVVAVIIKVKNKKKTEFSVLTTSKTTDS